MADLWVEYDRIAAKWQVAAGASPSRRRQAAKNHNKRSAPPR